MVAQMQGHGGVRCGLWSRIASLTLVLATHRLCTLPRNCSVPHVRSIYVIGLLRGTMTTHRKCLVQSSLYKVYVTAQAQPHLRNHSNLPIKPWVVKTSLPRWPEDLSLCEEWPFWGTHRLSKQVTPSQTTWPGIGMSASPVQTHPPSEGTRSGCSDSSGNKATPLLSPPFLWLMQWVKFLSHTVAGKKRIPNVAGKKCILNSGEHCGVFTWKNSYSC